jgi:hypothetical protein
LLEAGSKNRTAASFEFRGGEIVAFRVPLKISFFVD